MRLPLGFTAAGVACGVKKRGGLDLAVFLSDPPAAAAARFTLNRFRAAPILVSEAHLAASGGRARAIVVNSGCANAATGRRGLEDARRIARAAAKLTGARPEEILVASTGVIGERLPADRIVSGLPAAVSAQSRSGLKQASRSILTTDTRPKTAAARFSWRGRSALVAGCAKGAGMIHPNMATMLAFVFTDAAVAPSLLDRALAEASAETFEAISVDGDTSTNDTVFLLAGGASGVTVRARDRSFGRFLESLRIVCASLARQIVEDGEGARRAMHVVVRGARDAAGARLVARAVAVSPLVKTALAGGDANWGRILSAAGASGVTFDPGSVTVEIAGIAVARRGAAVDHDHRGVERAFRARRVPVVITLGRGPGTSAMTTCDLTEDYVRINADYRS